MPSRSKKRRFNVSFRPSPRGAAIAILLLALLSAVSVAEEHALHTFKPQQLTNVYFSEGANAGDINGDGHPDVVYGPYWFEGPDFTAKHEIYPAKSQPSKALRRQLFQLGLRFQRRRLERRIRSRVPGYSGFRV